MDLMLACCTAELVTASGGEGEEEKTVSKDGVEAKQHYAFLRQTIGFQQL